MTAPSIPRQALFLLLLTLAASARAENEGKPDEELKAAAEKFAASYDQGWKKTDQDGLKALVEDVRKVTSCGEDAVKKLTDGCPALVSKLVSHWHSLYHAYYLEHADLYSESGFWNHYPDMLASEPASKGLAAIEAGWNGLLKTALAADQLGAWQAELAKRKERRKALADAWLERWTKSDREKARKKFDENLDEVAEQLHLTKERLAEMKPVADAAVEKQMAVLRPHYAAIFRLWGTDFLAYRSGQMDKLEKGTDKFNAGSDGGASKAAGEVFDHKLRELLSKEETERMKKNDEEREARMAKLGKDCAERFFDQQQMEQKPVLEARLSQFETAVDLDEARKQDFEAKVRAAEKQIGEQWKKSFLASAMKRIHRSASGLSGEANLKQMETGRWWFSDEKADAQARQARAKAWEAAVTAVVTPDELARWKALEAEAGEARATMLAHMAVAELDRELLLQPDQREAAEKLVLKATLSLGGYSGKTEDLWQNELSGVLFVIPALDEKQVAAFLDQGQMQHYHELVEKYRDRWTEVQAMLARK